jgi:hypothetical protein
LQVFNATQGSIPKTISDLARNHGPRSHHHVVTAGVDMTVEPGMTAIRGPIGVAAVFSLFEVKDTHVFGPMRFRLHHHGDAIAGFLPGQRAFGWRTGAALTEYPVDFDHCGHQGFPKKKPGHEDRASCGNGRDVAGQRTPPHLRIILQRPSTAPRLP